MLPDPDMLVSINEREEKESQRLFYNKIEAEMSRKRIRRLQFWRNVSILYSPIFVLTFMIIYWIAGLRHADIL